MDVDHGPGAGPVAASGVRSATAACVLLTGEGLTRQVTPEGPLPGCESVAMSTGPCRSSPQVLSACRRHQFRSAGRGGRRGFMWGRIALKTVVAGPDVTELFLVNWNNKPVRTVFPF